MAFILLTAFFLGSGSFQNTVLALANDKPVVTDTKTETAQETQIPAENTNTAPWIASDKADYPPGAPVALNGGGWTGDSEVKIVIEGSSGKSQDWKLEKVVTVTAEGLIELKFNLPEWYVPQYNVAAAGLTTGRTAVTTFTDTGGSYSMDFSAADAKLNNAPYLPTYEKLTPSQLEEKLTEQQLDAVKSGRASDPLTNAVFGKPKDSVESLEPADMRVGTVVPYEVEITVKGSTSPENGIISFDPYWLTKTTPGDDFGFDPKYGILAAFVDYGDAANHDSGDNAKVEPYISNVANKGTQNEQIQSTIQVSGLDDGDTVIVEFWVVLKSKVPAKATGNVQAGISSAQTGSTGTAGGAISVGTQTVPLMHVQDFFNVDAEVSIKKTDNPDPLYPGSTLTYTITVNNNSDEVAAEGIVVTDSLDKNVTFVGASDGGTFLNGNITWPAFSLSTGGQKILTVTVTVNSNAPTDNYPGTASDNRGSSSDTGITSPDLLNMVTFAMITADLDITNNIWYEPTNVLPNTSITAYKVWVGGPEEDHRAVPLILYRQVGSGPREEVTGITPVITPPSGTADKFTYTWNGLPMYDSNFQPYIYTVDESTVPANYTKIISEDKLTITNTYKPSLIIFKVYGNTTLEGAVFELYAGDENGRTGEPLKSVTTGQDGKAVFEHLADGTYWLVEVKPPSGYKFIDDVGPIVVANGTISGPAGFTLTADGTTGNYIITIPNEPVRELPATGGAGTLPFAVMGLGLMMFAISPKKKR